MTILLDTVWLWHRQQSHKTNGNRSLLSIIALLRRRWWHSYSYSLSLSLSLSLSIHFLWQLHYSLLCFSECRGGKCRDSRNLCWEEAPVSWNGKAFIFIITNGCFSKFIMWVCFGGYQIHSICKVLVWLWVLFDGFC